MMQELFLAQTALELRNTFRSDVLEHCLNMFGEFRMSRDRIIRNVVLREIESQQSYT